MDQRLKVSQLASTDRMRERARAVAKLLYRAEDGFDYHCTGFLIGPDRLLTHQHCVGTDFRCATTLAIFGYLSENAPVEQARCSRLIHVDSDRDMAVIELDRRAGDRWGWLNGRSGPFRVAGGRKRIPEARRYRPSTCLGAAGRTASTKPDTERWSAHHPAAPVLPGWRS